MARVYSNENVPIEMVRELRRLGRDVVTSYDAGNANAGIPDEDVLAYALSENRVVLTNNRRDFIRLHRSGADHAGIVVFTLSDDVIGIAHRVQAALEAVSTNSFLARIDGIGFQIDER